MTPEWIKSLFRKPVRPADVGRVKAGFGRKLARVLGRLPVVREAKMLYRFAKDDTVPLPAKGVAVLALLYLIAPVDMAPDAIPLVGLLDDAAVILAAVSMLAPRLAKYREDSDDADNDGERVIAAEVVATR
jgi:uncharacterized membrane protein YkvA (DUF1232 family)